MGGAGEKPLPLGSLSSAPLSSRGSKYHHAGSPANTSPLLPATARLLDAAADMALGDSFGGSAATDCCL